MVKPYRNGNIPVYCVLEMNAFRGARGQKNKRPPTKKAVFDQCPEPQRDCWTDRQIRWRKPLWSPGEDGVGELLDVKKGVLSFTQ